LDSIDLPTGDSLISTLTKEEEEMLHHLTRWHQGCKLQLASSDRQAEGARRVASRAEKEEGHEHGVEREEGHCLASCDLPFANG